MLEIGVGIGGVAKFPDAARVGVGGPLLLDLTAEFPPGSCRLKWLNYYRCSSQLKPSVPPAGTRSPDRLLEPSRHAQLLALPGLQLYLRRVGRPLGERYHPSAPMDLLAAPERGCSAVSDLAPRPLPPARPAASVPVAPMAAADQIRRRFEDQRPAPAPARAESVVRSDAEAAARRERSPRRRSTVARGDGQESHRAERHAEPRSPRKPRSPHSPRSPRRAASRSRSPDRRSRRHRSPGRQATHYRSPAPHVSRPRSPSARSPRTSKRQRLYSPRHGGRSPVRHRQRVPSRQQSPAHSNASGRGRRGQRGGYGRGGTARQAPSELERVLRRLDGVEKALHRSNAEASSHSVLPAGPVVPLAALLPHNPEGSLARPGRPLPAGAGFVGAGGGDPWAAYAPLRPRSPPRDLAVSSRRTRAAAVLPRLKEVPTVTLARLWSLAESLQSLELILLESHGSMAVTPPSTFSQMPRARCHAAASALFSYVSPLQVAPSPGVVSATQLAEKALDLKTLVGSRGTPVDVVGATASVVRLMWLTKRETLAFPHFSCSRLHQSGACSNPVFHHLFVLSRYLVVRGGCRVLRGFPAVLFQQQLPRALYAAPRPSRFRFVGALASAAVRSGVVDPSARRDPELEVSAKSALPQPVPAEPRPRLLAHPSASEPVHRFERVQTLPHRPAVRPTLPEYLWAPARVASNRPDGQPRHERGCSPPRQPPRPPSPRRPSPEHREHYQRGEGGPRSPGRPRSPRRPSPRGQAGQRSPRARSPAQRSPRRSPATRGRGSPGRRWDSGRREQSPPRPHSAGSGGRRGWRKGGGRGGNGNQPDPALDHAADTFVEVVRQARARGAPTHVHLEVTNGPPFAADPGQVAPLRAPTLREYQPARKGRAQFRTPRQVPGFSAPRLSVGRTLGWPAVFPREALTAPPPTRAGRDPMLTMCRVLDLAEACEVVANLQLAVCGATRSFRSSFGQGCRGSCVTLAESLESPLAPVSDAPAGVAPLARTFPRHVGDLVGAAQARTPLDTLQSSAHLLLAVSACMRSMLEVKGAEPYTM
ncbi:unnamed protein product [Closterium sp. NIES-65]|nr:unnamed protein product [Closterium sp. NIES-65]